MLAFVVALALVGIFYQQLLKLLRLPSWASRVPGTIVVFMLGILVYHLAKWIEPALDLGPTIGKPDVGLSSPLLAVLTPGNLAQIGTIGGSILLISLVLALVASLESLMAFRAAQRVAEIRVHPIRDLAAQGLGNCATAIFAPIMSAATPTLLDANYRAGGRTRLSGIVAAAVILILGVLLSNALAAIPNAALSAVLATMGVMMFDKWSLRLAGQLVKRSSALGARRSWHDLIVVVAVMATTAMTTVVIGVIAGCLLSGIIFVVNMSRPVVRRKYSGSECFSKRIRSTEDVATLQKMGDRRAVLQLEGVLFFGNAENLATDVKTLFETADMIALDMRAITDIDASGTNILSQLVREPSARETAAVLQRSCRAIIGHDGAVRWPHGGKGRHHARPRNDAGMDGGGTLREHGDVRGQSDLLALEEIDFFDGVPDTELQELRGVLKLRAFKTGEPICREGDPGDKMWLLVKGSVSVRLSVGDHRGSRRITSLTRGTVFGEMALIEGAPRSASIVADEDVVCYELNGADFAMLLRDKPAIAATVMRNTARELARRLRRTSEDLRQATS